MNVYENAKAMIAKAVDLVGDDGYEVVSVVIHALMVLAVDHSTDPRRAMAGYIATLQAAAADMPVLLQVPPLVKVPPRPVS